MVASPALRATVVVEWLGFAIEALLLTTVQPPRLKHEFPFAWIVVATPESTVALPDGTVVLWLLFMTVRTHFARDAGGSADCRWPGEMRQPQQRLRKCVEG
jgi:hypothetical protein